MPKYNRVKLFAKYSFIWGVYSIIVSAGCKSETIRNAIVKLGANSSHNKLVAEFGFGFWRYIFAQHQFTATGRTMPGIFPAKPTSTATTQYNQTFVFNLLAQINILRNRIAHHEPICFHQNQNVKNTSYARQHYGLIKQLF